MPDLPISGLPSASALAGTEPVPIVQGGVTVKTTTADIAALASGVSDGDKGDITVSSSGAVWTIDAAAVSNSKLANVATATFKGRTTAGTGSPEDLTVAQAKTLLNLSGTNTGDQTITLTGDVTGSGTGSFSATIPNDTVTFAKIQNIGTNVLLGRGTAGTGDIETIALGTNLSLSGTTLNADAGPDGASSYEEFSSNTTATFNVTVPSNKTIHIFRVSTTPASGYTLTVELPTTGLTAGLLAVGIFNELGTNNGPVNIVVNGPLLIQSFSLNNNARNRKSMFRWSGTAWSLVYFGFINEIPTTTPSQLEIPRVQESGFLSDTIIPLQSRVSEFINQTAHGFSEGDLVKFTSSLEYELATVADGIVHGMVETVGGPNSFVVVFYGHAFYYAGGLLPDTQYYLSGTAGGISSTPTTAANEYVVPVFYHGDEDVFINIGSRQSNIISVPQYALLSEIAAPATPASGKVALYAKADNKVYIKDDTGTETDLTASVTDGDKGDITVSSSGTVWTIDNDAVTYSKIQNVAGNSFLGRAASGAGDVGEIAIGASELAGRGSTGNITGITLGTNLSMSGTTLNASGGGISDGDKGDITVSSGGTVWTIDNTAVSNAKLANVATATFKGRTTVGTGSPEDLTVAQAKTLLAISAGDVSGLAAIATSGSAADLSGTKNSTFIADFAEASQDTIGGILDATLVYNDATPSIGRAAITGDVTISAGSNAATIPAGTVTLAKQANLAANSIVGNNTGSSATPIALTGTQTTAMLDVFTSSAKGLVPASGGGTTNFLRADGTFAAPAGGGGNLNLCVVSYPLDSGGLNGTTLTGGAFTKVVFNTVDVDQASAWDSTNNEYVVPEDGIYFIATKLRPQDDSGEGRSYGQGSGITIADNASFSWFQGSNALDVSRNGSLNIRVMDLDSGDRVKMFYYLDGYSTTGQVEMTIYKL